MKEGRANARTRKIKRREDNIDKIFASISFSYNSSGVIDKVHALTLHQVKWIEHLLKSKKLIEDIRRTFLQHVKPAVKRVVAEVTKNEKDASSSEDEERNEEDSNKEESGKGESMGDQSSSDQDSGEGSINEVEE